MKTKRLNRFFALTLVLCLLAVAVAPVAFAASASVSIGLSARSVYIGNQVNVTVTYSSDSSIGSWNFSLQYDTEHLQYVSGADANPGAGILNFANYASSGGQGSVSYTVRFRTKALGNASVSTRTKQIVATDYSVLSVSEASRSIAVIEPPAASTENNLSALVAEGYEISPAFDAKVTEYTLSVPYAVHAVTLVGTPLSSAASVTVSGADALNVGENTALLTVKAESGDTRTYTVKITREASVYTAPSVALEGKTLTFPLDASEVTVPEGFSPLKSSYSGEPVLCFVNASASVTLAALLERVVSDTAPDGVPETRYFLFDAQKNTFAPFVQCPQNTESFVILEKPEALSLPEGFSLTSALLADTEVTAWKNERLDSRFLLVYASPMNGAADFYLYDTTANSFQLYAAETLPQGELSREELQAKLSASETHYDELYKITCFIVLGAGLCIFVLVLVWIITAAVRRRKARRQRKTSNQESDFSNLILPEEPAAAPQEFARAQSFTPPQETVVPQEFSRTQSFTPPQTAAPQEFSRTQSFIPPQPNAELTPRPFPQQEESRGRALRTPPTAQVFAPEKAQEDPFSKNNPLIDEDAPDDDDHPIYGFEDDE